MKSNIHPRQLNRRSGRTTRAIDEMVQHLFTHGGVEIWDHAESEDNLAFANAEKAIFNRLYHEHNLKRNAGFTYNPNDRVIRLQNFTPSNPL